MKMKILVFGISSFIFIACNKKNSTNYTQTACGNDISFPLDSLSTYDTKSLQFIKMNEKQYLAVYNKYTNSIYFYNFKTKQKSFIWKFPVEGSDAIKSIHYFKYINNDTIFLINAARNLYIIDSSLKIKKKIKALNLDYTKQKNPLADILWTNTLAPIIYNYPYVITNGIIFGYKNVKLMCSYNLIKEKFSLYIQYPRNEFYTSKERLYDIYYSYSTTYNKDKKLIVYSFPASEYVYTYTQDLKKDSFSLSTNKHADINPYISKVNLSGDDYLSKQSDKEYFSSILYDKYRKVYYRFFVTQNKNRAADPYEKAEQRNRILLVANDEGKKLFETELSGKKYEFRQMFVAPNGLYICNKEKSLSTEDSVYYSLLILK